MLGIESLEYWVNYRDGLEIILSNDKKNIWKKNEGEVDRVISGNEAKAIIDEIERVSLYINLLIAIKKNNGFDMSERTIRIS